MVGTVAVIGDGPSAEGKGWGPQIDACDAVVRLWNHEWQGAADYGTRYDYGLITLPEHATSGRRPSVSWLSYNGANAPEVAEIDGTPVAYIKFYKWVDRAILRGARPDVKILKLTRGFVAAAAAIDKLRPRRLVLVGMDLLERGLTMSPRYGPAAAAYRAKVWRNHSLELGPPGQQREAIHDHGQEAKLIRRLAKERGTEIAWGF